MIFQLLKKYEDVNWAVLDQGMVSGVNFLTGLLLARYLGIEAFGQFTLLWMAVLFLNAIQNAMISSPMMSIGSKQDKSFVDIYYRSMFYQQVIFSTLSFIILICSLSILNYLMPSWDIKGFIFPLSLAGVSFFCRKRPHLAFYNDVLSYLGQLILVVYFFNFLEGTLVTVLYIIGLTSCLSIVVGLYQIDKQIISLRQLNESFIRHWNSAKWLSLNTLLQWSSSNLIYIVSGSLLGNSAVGIMKASQNIMAITHIMFQAMENFVPMNASRVLDKNGVEFLKKYIRKVVLLGGGFTLIIAIAASLFSTELLNFLYDDQFEKYSYVLSWFSIIYVFMFLGVIYRIALRTIENTKEIFYSQILSTIFTFIFSYPLTKAFGLLGSMFSLFIVYIAVFVFLYVSFLNNTKSEEIKVKS